MAKPCYVCGGSCEVRLYPHEYRSAEGDPDDVPTVECDECSGSGLVSDAQYAAHVDAADGYHVCAVQAGHRHVGPCVHPGHPVYDAWLAREMDRAAEDGIPW